MEEDEELVDYSQDLLENLGENAIFYSRTSLASGDL